MHSCCMVESQVPGQCCGLGCCPANKCLTRVTTLMFKQENDKETHLKTRRTETQCKNPPQSNAPCGLGPVQDLRGVAVGVRAPQHRHTIRISSDAQSERFLDAQWLGSRLRGVNMASNQLFIKLKLRPGPTNWSKRTQFLQTKQKLWSNQSWSGVWCQLQLWHLRDVDAKAKHSSVINIDLWIYAYIAVYCKYEASHTQMERHPRSCPLSSKHVGIASYPRSYYFPFSAHRRWYPLEAPGGWKQPIKQGIIRDSSGDASSQCCKM